MEDDGIDPQEYEDFEPKLPEGVKKEILTEGEGYQRPTVDDEVTVHYRGTLASDGTEFDSSRGRDSPFVFTLGKGEVIKGWDAGVASMRKGELAKFTLAPEYGYGEQGSPPTIPANASLVFEIELLSWLSKADLFKDGGVIKTQLKEGEGWRSPQPGDPVSLSLKCTAKDGTIVEEKTDFEYVFGSGALGQLSKVVDRALSDFKTGEEAELSCTSEYALGDKTPDGATVLLTLHQVYEIKDVSFKEDKTLMKKRILEGDGFDTPKESYKLEVRVEETVAGSLPGFTAKTLEFTFGDGEVCDFLELAVADMTEGEKAVFTCTTPELCCEEQLGIKDLSVEKVVLTVELVQFEKGTDTWKMSEEEKVKHGTARKDVGAKLFKAGSYMLALGRYTHVCRLFGNTTYWSSDECKDKAASLKKACELNKISCQLRLKDYAEAKKLCDEFLVEEPRNEKALFRRGQANFELKNFIESLSDLKKLVQIDPQNKEARSLYKQVQAAQKEEDKDSKAMFANMCKGLGKSKAPEASQEQKDKDQEFAAVAGAGVPALMTENVALLAKHGVRLTAIEPLGAKVCGLDLRGPEPPGEVLQALQQEMATRGFLVFTDQGVLSGEEQCRASKFWGGREMHSTHGVHPQSPNKHIFRLSNDPDVGIKGVGPQWHNDGSFEVGVFSHVGYHTVRVPEKGGDTLFAHQGAAFDALPRAKQERWSRLISVNATSGVLHPLVHNHVISGRRSVYLHLGMTGGVLESLPAKDSKFRLLEHDELVELFHDYNNLLNAGLPEHGGAYAVRYSYQEGDCIFIDNLAIAHRASEQAHMEAASQGLRILHRSTVKAMQPFLPSFGLPPVATQELLANANISGNGVFVSGGLGFRWDESIRLQN